MKIVLTGSLGHISKPLAIALIQKGHHVTVISSNPDKQKEIEALGANAAIGKMEDLDFLVKTFKDAEIVYLMETAGNFFDRNIDYKTTIRNIVSNYKQAVEQNHIKHVVHLSSIGAHMSNGNGILAFHYEAENTLRQLPRDVSIKFMRPVGFYYNMFAFIPVIKATGTIIQNYGGDEKEPWVSPVDIAAAIAEEIQKPFEGRTVHYIASDEFSPNELAGILGDAIGKPDLKWKVVSDEQQLEGMLAAGMNPGIARGLVEMNAARRGGIIYEDYHRQKTILGKTKLSDFVKEFSKVYFNS